MGTVEDSIIPLDIAHFTQKNVALAKTTLVCYIVIDIIRRLTESIFGKSTGEERGLTRREMTAPA